MFTGIVSAIGEIAKIDPGPVTRLAVRSPYDPAGVEIGASINHAGVCLTVVAKRADGAGMIHDVEMVPETLAKTSLGALQVGSKLNLERALKAGEELGGHLLSGHVDGVGRLNAVTDEGGGSTRLSFTAPPALMPFIAGKGSIAIDGVSLTVASVEADTFSVAIIPHTALVTTLGTLRLGDVVNLEIDMIARYVARLLGREG